MHVKVIYPENIETEYRTKFKEFLAKIKMPYIDNIVILSMPLETGGEGDIVIALKDRRDIYPFTGCLDRWNIRYTQLTGELYTISMEDYLKFE